MPLLLSIVGATLLGFVIFMFGVPGLILAFGIVVGCLFRILFLLSDISSRLPAGAPKPTKHKTVDDAGTVYVKEQDMRE